MARLTWLVLGLLACNGDKDGTTPTDGTTTGDEGISGLTADNADIAGVVRVSFTAEVAGSARVEHVDGLAPATPTVAVDGAAEIVMLGLKVGTTHALKVVLEGSDGATYEAETTVDVPPPPQGMPAFTRPVFDEAKACDPGGYVLFSYIGQNVSGVGILDRDGKYVWAYKNPDPGTLIARARPGRDGASLLWNFADADRIDDVAEVVRMSMDGSTTTSTRTLNAHHDFVELPDGRLGWLGYDFRELDIPGRGLIDVAADTVKEDDEGVTDTTNTRLVYNVFDDYPYGVWDVGADMNEGVFLPGYHEFSHANSLAYRASDDAYFLMYRWLDAFVKVDRTTGQQLWQMGGRDNEFTGVPEDLFLHAHMSEIWDGGMLIFDNHDPGPSRLVEYEIDEVAKTYTKVWEFESDRLENLLGDVRRMPVPGCDNVIVSWSAQGRIVEMNRAGEVVWEVAAPIGQVTSRIHYLPSLYDFGGVAYPE